VEPDLERLRTIPVLRDLSDQLLARLASWVTEERMEEGERFAVGIAGAYRFYAIEEGTAVVRRHAETVRSLGPGDVVSESTVGFGRDGAVDVVATSPMRLLAMFGPSRRRFEPIPHRTADRRPLDRRPLDRRPLDRRPLDRRPSEELDAARA
jgi:hypothetical protein